jgi:hypothetical protein
VGESLAKPITADHGPDFGVHRVTLRTSHIKYKDTQCAALTAIDRRQPAPITLMHSSELVVSTSQSGVKLCKSQVMRVRGQGKPDLCKFARLSL